MNRKMRFRNYLPYLFFLPFLFISCHPFQKISKAINLEEQTPQFLIQKLTDNEFHCNWLSCKASVDVVRNKEEFNFSVSLRMRKDSAIWLYISPALGLEGFRILITKDSVKMMDKINKRYMKNDFKYLYKLFDLPVTFDMLQSVVLGNYFSYQDETKPRSSYVDNQYYLLSNLMRKKKLRSEEDIDLTNKIIHDIWLSPENYRIAASKTEDKKAKINFDLRYSDFRPVENGLFPYHSKLTLKADKPFQISIEYSKVSIDKPLEFPFNVPDNYEKIR